QNGSWNVRKLETLAEAVPLLDATDKFVLGLPVSAVLAQRFRLPSIDPTEFAEMIRIQIEKLLPFSADEVTTAFELIEQSDTESVVSTVAIRNERLAEIASPLLERGYIPRQITVYAAQRTTTQAPSANAVSTSPPRETVSSATTPFATDKASRMAKKAGLDRWRLRWASLTLVRVPGYLAL